MDNQQNSKPPTQFGNKSFSSEQENHISSCLSKKLGKDNTTSRVGAGNSKFTYIESWRSIQLANAIFGFNGWSCSVVDLSPDFIEENNGRYSVGITAVVRVTLKDGTSHEDVGYGCGENPRRGAAIEKAKKEAVSDARKRTLRLFGDALGNCLYDKQHLKRIKSGKAKSGDDILVTSNLSFSSSQVSNISSNSLNTVKNEQKKEIYPPFNPVKKEIISSNHCNGNIKNMSQDNKRNSINSHSLTQIKSEINSPQASYPSLSPPNNNYKQINNSQTLNNNGNINTNRYHPYNAIQKINSTQTIPNTIKKPISQIKQPIRQIKQINTVKQFTKNTTTYPPPTNIQIIQKTNP